MKDEYRQDDDVDDGNANLSKHYTIAISFPKLVKCFIISSLCVRYRTKELEASGKQVGLKTIFLFRTRRTHFRRGKKKEKLRLKQ